LVLTLGACGSDSTSSGVDGDTLMSALSKDEATHLCKAHQADFDGIASVGCIGQGVATRSKTSCETTRTQCEANDMGATSVDCTAVDTSQLVGCDVKVSVAEGCLDDIGTWAKGITCSLAESPDPVPDPPSCFATLQSNCPLFAGG
jgi:hypothetical protein